MPPATDLARAREIEQNPVADAWTAKDEENIAFLNEDQQALADVYDSLVASGILHEADADRETVSNASGAGDDVALPGMACNFSAASTKIWMNCARTSLRRRRNWKPCGAMRPTPWASTGQ